MGIQIHSSGQYLQAARIIQLGAIGKVKEVVKKYADLIEAMYGGQ